MAALVFLITFLAVSAATDGSSAEPSVAANAPLPPGLQTAEPADTEAAQVLEHAEPEATPEASEPAAEPETAAPEPARPLPEFDEAELIHGGTDALGATLGGPGIVASTGADHATPWEILIPSARIRASIVSVALTPNGALGAPDNPYVIGWWERSPAPGQVGNVLLDGHRDFTDTSGNVGTAVCWQLPDTGVGDFIIIRDAEAGVSYVYTVSEVVSVIWNDPAGAAYLRATTDARLTLVTCEGAFDEDDRNYSNRRIVVALLSYSTTIMEPS